MLLSMKGLKNVNPIFVPKEYFGIDLEGKEIWKFGDQLKTQSNQFRGEGFRTEAVSYKLPRCLWEQIPLSSTCGKIFLV